MVSLTEILNTIPKFVQFIISIMSTVSKAAPFACGSGALLECEQDYRCHNCRAGSEATNRGAGQSNPSQRTFVCLCVTLRNVIHSVHSHMYYSQQARVSYVKPYLQLGNSNTSPIKKPQVRAWLASSSSVPTYKGYAYCCVRSLVGCQMNLTGMLQSLTPTPLHSAQKLKVFIMCTGITFTGISFTGISFT